MLALRPDAAGQVYVVTADVEGAVVRNIERKERQATKMMEQIVANMAERTLRAPAPPTMTYEADEATGDGWRLLLGDCVERLADVERRERRPVVFSPPFPSMYVYTNSPRDMGNVADVEEMIEHFGYLLPELYRVTMPGRSVAIHLAQAQTRKRDGGEIGLRDFRGATIDVMDAPRLHVLRRGHDRQGPAGEGDPHEGSRPAVQDAGEGLRAHAHGPGRLPAPVPQAGREPAPDPGRHLRALRQHGRLDHARGVDRVGRAGLVPRERELPRRHPRDRRPERRMARETATSATCARCNSASSSAP
jgi:hypothetical protein